MAVAAKTPSELAAALDDVRGALVALTDSLVKMERQLQQKLTRMDVLARLLSLGSHHLSGLCKGDGIVSLPEYKRMNILLSTHRNSIEKLKVETKTLKAKVAEGKRAQDRLKEKEAELQTAQAGRGKLLQFRGRHG
jgi:hypothetical protein